MRRSLTRISLLTLFAITMLSATAGPAAAHTYLERSEPGEDDIVTEEVTEIVLEFNQAVNQSIADLEVTAPDGAELGMGEVSIDGEFVRREVEALPVEGEYEVSWRVVASDGHPREGEFAFVYEGPVPEATPTPTPEPTEEPAEATPEPTEEATSMPPEGDDAAAGGAEMATPPPMGEEMAADDEMGASATADGLPVGLLAVTGLVILALVLAAGMAIRGLLRWQPPREQTST